MKLSMHSPPFTQGIKHRFIYACLVCFFRMIKSYYLMGINPAETRQSYIFHCTVYKRVIHCTQEYIILVYTGLFSPVFYFAVVPGFSAFSAFSGFSGFSGSTVYPVHSVQLLSIMTANNSVKAESWTERLDLTP